MTLTSNRYKNYEATHARLIALGKDIMAQGITLSMSALSRASKIDRSALYYHFGNVKAMKEEIEKAKSESLEERRKVSKALAAAGVQHRN